VAGETTTDYQVMIFPDPKLNAIMQKIADAKTDGEVLKLYGQLKRESGVLFPLIEKTIESLPSGIADDLATTGASTIQSLEDSLKDCPEARWSAVVFAKLKRVHGLSVPAKSNGDAGAVEHL
jgi:hypothetical protein